MRVCCCRSIGSTCCTLPCQPLSSPWCALFFCHCLDMTSSCCSSRAFSPSYFLVPAVVLGIPHTASDRKPEVRHQPGGVCVRRSCHLFGHHADLPGLAANYRLVQISPLEGNWPTLAYTCKYQAALLDSITLYVFFVDYCTIMVHKGKGWLFGIVYALFICCYWAFWS